MNSTTFIMLGRVGDILNILPAVYEHRLRTGVKPFLVVAEAFASLLESLDYCEGEAFPGEWMNIHGAINWVIERRPFTDLRICAVCGTDYSFAKSAWNFQRESWRFSRCPAPWGTVPLVLHRDHDREKAVANALVDYKTEKYVLLSLSGISSPVPAEVQALIRDRLSAGFKVVDISNFRAERIQDLLLLMSWSSGMVLSDSALLHLARAVPHVRVAALISDNPSPWFRSWWTPNQVFRCCYSEVPDHIDELVGSLSGTWRLPNIIHCWSKMEFASEDTRRRMRVAQESWRAEYAASGGKWIEAPLHDRSLMRDARGSVGDPHPMPFIRDIVDHGAARASSDTDILVVTNADVGWPTGITGAIYDAIRMHGSAWTHRWDKENATLDTPLVHEWDVADLRWYCGSDLFAFTVGWWRTIGRDFPDMILGREAWDYVFRMLVRRHHGQEIHRCLFHERHTSFWETAGNRESLPGNRHNMALARAFMQQHTEQVADVFTPKELVFAL